MVDSFSDIESQRQEFAVLYGVARKLIDIKNCSELHKLIRYILCEVFKESTSAFIPYEKAKRSHKMKEIYNGSREMIPEKISIPDEPGIRVENGVHLLLCPVKTKTDYLGTILLAGRNGDEVGRRKRFFTLLSETISRVKFSQK